MDNVLYGLGGRLGEKRGRVGGKNGIIKWNESVMIGIENRE